MRSKLQMHVLMRMIRKLPPVKGFEPTVNVNDRVSIKVIQRMEDLETESEREEREKCEAAATNAELLPDNVEADALEKTATVITDEEKQGIGHSSSDQGGDR